MLADTNALATIAVKDLAIARNFCAGTLQLRRAGPDDMGVATYQSGESTILIYESQYAVGNRASCVT